MPNRSIISTPMTILLSSNRENLDQFGSISTESGYTSPEDAEFSYFWNYGLGFSNCSKILSSGTAVVKVADDVRGHSTDSLIHKDHVDVVTVALIHFVALIHGWIPLIHGWFTADSHWFTDSHWFCGLDSHWFTDSGRCFCGLDSLTGDDVVKQWQLWQQRPSP